MNLNNHKICYRGFSPRKIEVNYHVSKPALIYRGYEVCKALLQKPSLSTDIALIYRGVRMNKGGYKDLFSNNALSYAY